MTVSTAKKVLLIKADGEIQELPASPSFRRMQELLGGYIEHVRVLDRIENGRFIYTSMYVNDSRLLNGLPRNEKATEIYQRNVRTQFANSENPFKAAEEEFINRLGATNVIRAYPAPEYADDPYIAGDAIVFSGYRCEQADKAVAAATENAA